MELDKARAQAAIEHSQLSVKLAVLATKHEELSIELGKNQSKVARDEMRAKNALSSELRGNNLQTYGISSHLLTYYKNLCYKSIVRN